MAVRSTFEDAQRIYRRYGVRDPFQIIDGAANWKLWYTSAFGKDGLKGFATIQNQFKYIVINSCLEREDQRIIAAHEMGHIVRHEAQLRICPMRDMELYRNDGKLEREANIFAADLLLDDDEVMEQIRSCESDFFSTASALYVPAPLFSFKLYSMVQRGYSIEIPMELDSRFLAPHPSGHPFVGA